jgi:NTP pyrophosphatase (non-canonical NTP hydrolase)
LSYPTYDVNLKRLSEQCVDDSWRWFGDTGKVNDIVHHTLAMAGEVGEFANIVKKIDRGSLDVNDPGVRKQLGNELTDVLVYLLNIVGLLGIDLDACYRSVRLNNEKRFTAEREAREQRNGDQQGRR